MKNINVLQGEIEKSWIMTFLNSIWDDNEKIKEILLNTHISPKGIYRVTIYKNGEPVIVTLDDYIPCYPGSYPMFTRLESCEIWIHILEKAYAKLYGCYLALQKDFNQESIIDFIGAPASILNVKNPPNGLWNNLNQYVQYGYKMIAVANTGEEKKYCLIDQAEMAENIKLIRLGNTYSNYVWTGDWNNSSELWTNDLLDILDIKLSESHF